MTQAVVALFDDRPFFEKVVAYGVQHGVLDQAKLDAIQTDAPKGMVQIARYFGSEFLRPELEKAKDRIVNMVSLTLQIQSGGDLRKAAEHLREHSFMSRSKAASDMLKALIVMPRNTHFSMNSQSNEFEKDSITELAMWTLCSLSDYQNELKERQKVAGIIDTARWMANQMRLKEEDLTNADFDAEAVVRTALLATAVNHKEMPDRIEFQKIIATLRKSKKPITFKIPADFPSNLKPVLFWIREQVYVDLPKLLNTRISFENLFQQNEQGNNKFNRRYFWKEKGGLFDVDDFDRRVSKIWVKATSNHSDDSSLLTLFLCIATGSTNKTVFTEDSAKTLIRKIRKSGIQPELVTAYIQTYAPDEHKDDYLDLWEKFVDDSLSTLESDHDYKLYDALALLRRECNIIKKTERRI